MEKEKIFTYLKGKLTDANNEVSEATLNALTDSYSKKITEEAQIPTVINDTVLDAIRLSISEFRKEGDRRATEATQSAVKNFRTKHGLDENGNPISTEPEPTKVTPADPNEPSWFKAWREKQEKELGELKKKYEGIENSKTQSELMNKFHVKLKEKGIDELFIPTLTRNLKIESEDKIDQLVTETEVVYKDLVQKSAEKGVIISKPVSPDKGKTEGVAVGESIARKRNTASSEGVRGKLDKITKDANNQ